MTIGLIGKMVLSVIGMFSVGKGIEMIVDWGLQKPKSKKKSQSLIEGDE